MSSMRHRGRMAAALLAVVLAAGPLRAQEAPAPQAAKAEVLTEVWRLVESDFYDPGWNGVDWPGLRAAYQAEAGTARGRAELSAVINRMLAELDASHTAHYTPDDIAYYHLMDVFSGGRQMRREIERLFPGEDGPRYDGIGALFETDEAGRTFVGGVWAGFPAEAAGLEVGDEIVAADGAPFHPVRSFRGRAGETVLLSVRSSAGGPARDVPVDVRRIRPADDLAEAMRASARIIERDGVGVGYIRVWSYAGGRYHRLLVEEMATGALAGADALVIDLRGGWGGAQPDYLQPFLPGPTMVVTGRGEDPRYASFRWRRPVGLLVDEGTRSGKEVLADAFTTYDLGPVIGERTAGALLAGRAYVLSDGSLLYLAVADVVLDGRRLEGVGAAPDIAVPFTPRHTGGADPQLDRALEEMSRLAG